MPAVSRYRTVIGVDIWVGVGIGIGVECSPGVLFGKWWIGRRLFDPDSDTEDRADMLGADCSEREQKSTAETRSTLRS